MTHVSDAKGQARPTRSDDQRRAARAAHRDRPQPVRRARLRGHLDRGDRRPGRGVQADRLRALRRQGGPVRRRRRPRGAPAARHDAVVADRQDTRASCWSRPPSRCSATSRSPRTASASSCATPRSARSRARSSRSSATSRHASSTSSRPSSSSRGFDVEVRADVRPDAGRHGRARPASGGSTRASRPRRSSPRTWSTWPGTACPVSRQRPEPAQRAVASPTLG